MATKKRSKSKRVVRLTTVGEWFETRYCPATDTKPSFIRATFSNGLPSRRYPVGQTVENTQQDVALRIAAELGWSGLTRLAMPRGFVWALSVPPHQAVVHDVEVQVT